MKNKKYLVLFSIFIISNIMCQHNKIFITSVPKSGTHLLGKLLTLLTGQIAAGTIVGKTGSNIDSSWLYITPERLDTITPDQFLVSHALPIESNISLLERYGYKGIFIYRDPRDQVISRAYHLIKYKVGTIHRLPLEKVITRVICNYPIFQSPYYHDINLKKLNNIRQNYDIYLPWKDHGLIYVTTFEKLIGPAGGGTEEVQVQEIKNIARHIGLEISDVEAKKCADQLFGDTNTFRAGKIGSYKEHFTLEQTSLFKRIVGDLLIQLKYEQGLDW